MSLDWEHEPSLWGLRAKHIGDGHCDRSGCGAKLCECNFEGGDCVSTEESGGGPYPVFLLWSALIYLGTMLTVLREIRHHLKAPKLRDQGELTSYVTKMQRAQPQVSFTVVCSHKPGGSTRKTSGPPNINTNKVKVTHRSSHPFMYATSTDASTLTKNWQQPAGGGGEEDGSVGTGFVAVVSSGLSWSAAKGVTADKLKAEKERLHAENKHRDKDCSVTVKVSLPDQLPHQLYVPTGMKSRQLPAVVELLLVFFGLGAPLYFYYTRSRLSRHIEHKVHKTIYIEGHSAPAVEV